MSNDFEPMRAPDENNNKPEKKPRRKLPIIIACVAAAVAVVAVVQMVSLKQEEDHGGEVYEQLQEFVEETPTPAPTEEVEATPEPEETENPRTPDKLIDFESLQAQNEDIFAWIEIPGTEIEYPIVWSGDNEYYLGRDINRESSKSGSIFLAGENIPDLDERHLVIYGHNMRKGDMFAQLHNFEDAAFFDENKRIKIYTPEGQYNYEIFAAYERDDLNLMYEMDYNSDFIYQQYLDSIQDNRGLNAHIEDPGLTVEDNIITLSTCIQGQDQKRYLVQAVLIEDE